MAYFNTSADRTRRTFEDAWLTRILYVIFLFTPFFYSGMKYENFAKILAIALFITWLTAIYKVRGNFWIKPENSDGFLRNIVYD